MYGPWILCKKLQPEIHTYVKESLNGYIYYRVELTGGKKEFVHRLVLWAFVGPPPFEKAQGCHKNDNGLDNQLKNLEWGAHKYNQWMKGKSGQMSMACGNCSHLSQDHDETDVCRAVGCWCPGYIKKGE